MRRNRAWCLGVLLAAATVSGCAAKESTKESIKESTEESTKESVKESTTESSIAKSEDVTLLVAAAASLKNCCDEELIPMFEEANPGIHVTATYDSSGKLQTQIEEGLEADLFLSAANKQMEALAEEKLVDETTIVPLLENQSVLIVPSAAKDSVSGFEEILQADHIAIGDPESVPAGQYAKEVLESLNLWEEVEKKASLGTNVTEVLNWVAEGSADVGIVYATDAASNDKVRVVASAPEGSLETKIIYPAAVTAKSSRAEEAKLFLEFLQSEEAMTVFEQYGFSAAE